MSFPQTAAGATRLLASPGGRFAAAEVERRGSPGESAPELRLIDLAAGRVEREARGWAVGPPDDDGDLLLLEEERGEALRYRVRSLAGPEHALALEPPAGEWRPKAALRTPGGPALVVLWAPVPGVEWRDPATRRERLWIASLATAPLGVRTARVIESATPMRGTRRFGHGAAVNPLRPDLYLLELPEPGGEPVWRVRALDGTSLEERFTVALPRGGGKLSHPDAGHERTGNGAALACSGDGRFLTVIYGRGERAGVMLEAFRVLDAASGALLRDLPGAELRMNWYVSDLAPVPGSAGVATLHRLHFREGSGERFRTAFHGISVLNCESGREGELFEASREFLGDDYRRARDMAPEAICALPGGAVLAAPRGP